MIVTGVDLSSDGANVLSFPLEQPGPSDPYYVKTIIGLDADEIVHKYYGQGAETGTRYFSFRLPSRTLVMRIFLNPDYSVGQTVQGLRDNFYRMISAGRGGKLNVLLTANGAAVATISGFFSKMEVPHFSKEPELQVTLECDDPMLRAYSPNELLAPDISTSNPITLGDALSTAPHGLKFEVEFTATTSSFTIQDQDSNPDWTFTITPTSDFLSGDKLCISTEFNNRTVFMDRASAITYLMDRIDPGSVWPTVFPGLNEFHFPEIANFDWLQITHYPAYWGV